MKRKTKGAVLAAAVLLICVLISSTAMADTETAGTSGISMENSTDISGDISGNEEYRSENQENYRISPYEEVSPVIIDNSTSVLAATVDSGQPQEKVSGSVSQQTAQTAVVKNVPQTSDNEAGTLAGAGMILLTLLAAVLAAAGVRKQFLK